MVRIRFAILDPWPNSNLYRKAQKWRNHDDATISHLYEIRKIERDSEWDKKRQYIVAYIAPHTIETNHLWIVSTQSSRMTHNNGKYLKRWKSETWKKEHNDTHETTIFLHYKLMTRYLARCRNVHPFHTFSQQQWLF